MSGVYKEKQNKFGPATNAFSTPDFDYFLEQAVAAIDEC